MVIFWRCTMIDIHSHILFKLDDGSKDLDMSLNMIKKLQKLGFSDFILTPHYRPSKNYTATIEERQKRFKQLEDRLKKENSTANIYLGTEFDATDDLHHEIELAPSMNHKKFILLDCMNKTSDFTEIAHNMHVKGYTLIIAHVERVLSMSIRYIELLKKQGVLFQLNLSSLSPKSPLREKRRAKILVKKKLVDFIGTDLHSESTDEVEMGLKKLKKLANPHFFQLITKENALSFLL